MDRINSKQLSRMVRVSKMRDHRFKVGGRRFKGDLRETFSHKLGIWNVLPNEMSEAGGVTTIQRHLDRYSNEQGIDGYRVNAGGISINMHDGQRMPKNLFQYCTTL